MRFQIASSFAAFTIVVAGTYGCQDNGGTAGNGGSGGSSGSRTSSSNVSAVSSGGATSASSVTVSSSSSGATSSSGACRPKFASGVNVAWFNFASDVPNPNITDFTQLYTNISPVGGRVVRWWFHTDGTNTPEYDPTTGLASISTANIADVKKILDAAYAAGEAVTVSLWSFDMMKQTNATILANNKNLLQKAANRQAYATNVITPLVTALKGHPGLYAWEIFNEAEGMIDDGPNTTPWTGSNYVSIKDVQACVNIFASAIHTADPSALVTTAAWTFLAIGGQNSTTGPSGTNYYSDTALTAAGGQANGTLDFYEVHYYDNWGTVGAADGVSPFIWSAASWKLDKPILVGEFWDIDSPGTGTTTIKAADLYTTLYTNGYKGAWAWQYANSDTPGPTSTDAGTKWPAMQTPMQNLFTAHKADLECQ
jgi:hypothetical protein